MVSFRSARWASKALLPLVLAAAGADARVFVVDAERDGADSQVGDGICADATGACTLRAAIQEANALAGADEIWLQPWSPDAPISYRIDIGAAGNGEDHAATGDLDIRDSLVVRRHPDHDSGLVEIAGNMSAVNPADRIFDVHLQAESMQVLFTDLMVANGVYPDPEADGAGVRIGAIGSVELRRVVLSANFGHGTGTALSVHGRAALVDSVVFDNHQSRDGKDKVGGGALRVAAGATLDIDNVLVTDNRVWRGGALLVEGAGAVARVRRAFFRNGVDIAAGAGGQVLVENATLVGQEQARADAGGRIELVHTTLSRTLASAPSVVAFHVDGSGAGISLANSVVEAAAGGPANCSAPAGAITSLGGNVFAVGPPCAIALQSSDRVVVDPQLVAVRAPPPLPVMPGTYHYAMAPAPGSPVIDAAVPQRCPVLDQFGSARPEPASGAACDSGAIEWPLDRLFDHGFELSF